MASFGLGLLLLLLLLTTHPGSSKAQHWSHGWYPGGKRASSSSQEPQHAPWLPAGSPGQIAHSLPSNALAPPEDTVPWEGKTMVQWLLRGKQHLVQKLLVSRAQGPQHWPGRGWGWKEQDTTEISLGPAIGATCYSVPPNLDSL
ncbi:progonadoliberin-2 isoform X1 [Sus scrofa]|uniref:progonadoliberin-2 isoform X1 n=1 Tax=Sus scrofa TaxID=9823 RepID=UPI0003AE9048|nr:progonadoliberin-2 isoform X1 [Sus scrofa]